MGRLTIPDVRVDEHTTRRSVIDVAAVREHAMEFYWRLKAYEDKGCEPEKVLPKDKADEIALKLMRLADLESICSYTRLRELAEADKDGRVVVLPCKVGDTVYRVFTVDGREPVIQATQVKTFGQAADLIGRIGKLSKLVSVFRTREEAERAMQEMEGAT